MKCPDCGAENLEGAAYCEDCGSKLPVAVTASAPPIEAATPQPVAVQAPPVSLPGGMIKCGSCGAENPATESYCEDCGASLGAAAQPAVSPDAAVQSNAPPVAAPQVITVKMTVTTSGREFNLGKDVITIGRRSPADGIYPDVDLTDDDPESYISRRHAQIIKQNEAYIFEDVGSSNGSFLNNVRANKGEQHLLKDNDQLRLGKTEMVFKLVK